jgi:site-specific recombinase XerD
MPSPKIRGVYEKVPGSGIWYIHFYDQHGRRHREKVGPKSLAIAAYQRRKSDIRIGKFFPEQIKPKTVLFDHLAADALEYSRQNRVAAGQYNDELQMKVLLSWFRRRPADSITSQDIERRLETLSEKGRAPATFNHYRALLNLCYSLGMRNGKVKVNPVRGVPKKTENNERTRHASPEEEKAIRAEIREACPEHEPELDLALHTGMRRAEQYKLRWDNIDLNRGMITIPLSKHGKKRHIPVNSVALGALMDLARLRKKASPFVVPGRAKVRKKDQREWFEDAVEAAGVKDFKWHDLRHTFASRLVMAGVDLRTVQELMGHRTIAMTVRYSHLATSHLNEAIERLATATGTATSQNQQIGKAASST